ncbi:MAG: uracil-DNA glycosylase [Nitratireductor sp.]
MAPSLHTIAKRNVAPSDPGRDCGLCPRLKQFRERYRISDPDWHNAPVPTWVSDKGDSSVRFLVVGLAPGLRGANRTGRPFTGDYAGDLLYATLVKFGMARGRYGADPADGLFLNAMAITNSVRCVPPENKPVGAEINSCRPFLSATLDRFENLEAILTLGKIAHDSTLRMLGARVADAPFSHGGQHEVGKYRLFSSYHCSRYNTNTGRLTPEMFENVFREIAAFLSQK